MRESKKNRLIAKGWRVGSAAEFLGLSTEETAYVELKLSLAANLRETRRRRRLTQADLAKAVHSSQSRIAKMEAADSSVSLDSLIRTLLALGASSRQIAQTIAPPSARPSA